MDGLECSEVSFLSLERTYRIDSEYYKKDFVKLSSILAQCNLEPLTHMVKISDGNHMSISNKFIEIGVPYYRGQDINTFFIENSKPICIDMTTFNLPYMERSHLKKGDILLSIVGTIGSLAIVYSENKATCSCKLAILRPKAESSPEVISTFLRGKYGQFQIKKLIRGAVQMGLILEDMDQLYVPLFSNSLENIIQDSVKSAFNLDNFSRQKYAQAEKILLDNLGMSNFIPSSENVMIKNFSESFSSCGRLDAEYYQSKYDNLFVKLAAVQTYPLGNLVWIKKSVEPGSGEYLSEGIPFVRVSDLSKYGLSKPEIHLNRIPFAHMDLQPKKDTILLTKDGSVGIAYKVEKDLDIVTSGAILHLILKTSRFSPDYLTLVLNSQIVKLQAERDAGGSVIQHWKPSEIGKVMIPWLPMEKQMQIAEKLQESFLFRHESEKMLERAKQAVEMAIETDEQSALDWLSSQEKS